MDIANNDSILFSFSFSLTTTFPYDGRIYFMVIEIALGIVIGLSMFFVGLPLVMNTIASALEHIVRDAPWLVALTHAFIIACVIVFVIQTIATYLRNK